MRLGVTQRSNVTFGSDVRDDWVLQKVLERGICIWKGIIIAAFLLSKMHLKKQLEQ